MAIIDISKSYAPRTRPIQKFWNTGGRQPKKSDAQKASEILAVINASIATGQGLYNLGKGIYEDFQPSKEEQVAELQSQAVASRAAAISSAQQSQADFRTAAERQAEATVDTAVESQRAQQLIAADAQERAAMAPLSQKSRHALGHVESAIAQTFPDPAPPTRLADPRYAAGFPSEAPAPEAQARLQRLANITPARMREIEGMLPEGIKPAYRNKVRGVLESRAQADARMAPPQQPHVPASVTGALTHPLQKAALDVHTADIAAGAQLPEGRVFADLVRSGNYRLADLNTSYRSLIDQGRQDEADAILRLATTAVDFPGMRTSVHEPDELIRLRAERTIMEGAGKGQRPRLDLKSLVKMAGLVQKPEAGSSKGSGGGRGSRYTYGNRNQGDAYGHIPDQLFENRDVALWLFWNYPGGVSKGSAKSVIRDIRRKQSKGQLSRANRAYMSRDATRDPVVDAVLAERGVLPGPEAKGADALAKEGRSAAAKKALAEEQAGRDWTREMKKVDVKTAKTQQVDAVDAFRKATGNTGIAAASILGTAGDEELEKLKRAAQQNAVIGRLAGNMESIPKRHRAHISQMQGERRHTGIKNLMKAEVEVLMRKARQKHNSAVAARDALKKAMGAISALRAE